MLRRKENSSIYIIREAVACFRNPVLLWSIGKDSTALLHMAHKAFFGSLPFPVLHIDTGRKFPEMYQFRDLLVQQWGLNLIVWRNQDALDSGRYSCKKDPVACCHQLKTVALQQAVAKHGFDALLVGIRRDEHGVRAKERYFSPRGRDFSWDYKHQPVELIGTSSCRVKDGRHVRIHPLLHWSELDIWCYTQLEGIPTNPLYFARNGHRYRSLGCKPATEPVISEANTLDRIIEELCKTHQAERAGRIQDKESAVRMQRLRALGYM